MRLVVRCPASTPMPSRGQAGHVERGPAVGRACRVETRRYNARSAKDKDRQWLKS